MKTCGECDDLGCLIRGFTWQKCLATTPCQAGTNEQIKAIPSPTINLQEMEAKQVDWFAFRREAAKDILAGILANPNDFVDQDGKQIRSFEGFVDAAINAADLLIAKLKEDKQ